MVVCSLNGRHDSSSPPRHITVCHNLADLAKVPEPKAVLASMPDLECGFSRDLFVQWASLQRNSIILTSKPSSGTVARSLIDNLNVKSIDIVVRQRVYLEGEELEVYRLKEGEKARLEAEKQTELAEDSDEEMEVDPSTSSGPPKTPKHDLMMEEGRAKSVFFKQAKSFPMFPFREEKLKWDEYGEPIRPEDYKVKDQVVPVTGGGAASNIEVGHPVKQNELSTIPTKCIAQKQTIPIRCSLSFIDFEGKSDGESIKRILTIVKPRQLVVVHGSRESTNSLVDFAKKTLSMTDDKVMAPHVGEVVNATTESLIYQVKLKDSLMSSISFSQAKDAELAWLDGEIHFAQTTSHIEEEGTGDKREGLVPVLGPVSVERGHPSVFINPPRLSDFRQVLTKAGISAEFSGGVLVCNGVVAIRRTEGGGISLEGTVCQDYYTVRKLLYEQFAII